MTKNIILIIITSLFLNSCTNSNSNFCFEEYNTKSSNEKRPFIKIDSTVTNKSGCKYFINAWFPIEDSLNQYFQGFHKGVLFQQNEKIYMKFTKPESERFLLFDMTLPVESKSKIEINYLENTNSFDCILEKKVIIENNIEVFLFRIKNLFYYYHSDKLSSILDVRFFVTKEHGIIGDYFTVTETDGVEVLIKPSGEILEDYIDYSKFKKQRLL